ncbi:transporter [Streptomyces sp. CC53]|uniref:transporter n=1 Tax=unclassified Streptomyces TaxID=2593676 RepID=UPI0008DC76B9|nr:MULTISPECIES: transporter [unclassified Streptomyces]OII66074.1 transporter [Streptomyces sp. CC53]
MSTRTPAAAPSPSPPAPSLTSTLVRLKLSLLRNGLRQSSGRTAAFVVSVVFAVLFAAAQLLGLLLLRGTDAAATVAVLSLAVLGLGWAVMPLFFPSGDETLDPTRLVMLPLRAAPLVRGLLVASLVGVGPLFTLCVAVGAGLSVARGAGAVALAGPAVLVALLVCVALARAVAAANIRLLTSRKGRDLALLSGLVVAVGIQVVNFGAQRLGAAGTGLAPLEPAAAVARWVPPASAVAAVDSASRGAWAEAVAQLLLSVAALGLLLVWWQRSLTKLMTAPDASTLAAAGGGAAKRSGGRGAGLWPEGRTGAVVQRTLRYAWRDPKTKSAWVTSLVLGLIIPLFNAVQGVGTIYWACFGVAMLGFLMFNQFGQDTSAFWMVALTISSPRDAYEELRARALALLLVSLPYVTLVTGVMAAVLGDWEALPGALGLSYGLLGSLVALGALSSAFFPYSIPQDSAYKNVAPGQGALAWLSMGAAFVGMTLLTAPVAGLQAWSVLSGRPSLGWLVLVVGAVWGALLAWAGLRWSATRTAARLPEILTAVSKA